MTYTAKASINVTKDASFAWQYLADFRNLAKFLSNVQEVKGVGEGVWEWRLQGVLGIPLFCKTTSTLIENGKRIVWDSLEGSIASYGWIQIENNPSGSTITMSLTYRPPLGVINDVFAKRFQDPQAVLERDLKKLEQSLSQSF